MKRSALTAALLFVLSLPPVALRLDAQASDLPSAAPVAASGQSATERGRQLLDQMVAALGGKAWLDRSDVQVEGRSSAFFHGEPNPYITEFHDLHRFSAPVSSATAQTEADRVGFLTARSMILPGKKIDVVQIWTADQGTEITYKGATSLPKDQVEDYYRRRAHSIENVVRNWLSAPGVMIVCEGTVMVDRHLADRVSVLTANNDAVTFDLDAATHLPLRRTFQWRNDQFKDHDEDSEGYDDYHTIQGLPTPLTITRYHNGEMVSQRFLTRVVYNIPLTADLFDPTVLLKKK
ncbi:MAG: hypothetical protein P4K80_06460 [Acidobacteriaceae bacterium]|nr:hypothetical protein [Acidobacteriaceae bacterium]